MFVSIASLTKYFETLPARKGSQFGVRSQVVFEDVAFFRLESADFASHNLSPHLSLWVNRVAQMD